MTDAAIIAGSLVDVTPPKRVGLSLRDRIDHSSMPVPFCGCWIWLLALNHAGYGVITVDGGAKLAHRASWIAFKGAIPDGQAALHQCDMPACVNPDHLFLGTQTENMADKKTKGRNRRGGAHQNSKLTVDQVREIRQSTRSSTLLAAQMKVSPRAIRKVREGKTWGHIDD